MTILSWSSSLYCWLLLKHISEVNTSTHFTLFLLFIISLPSLKHLLVAKHDIITHANIRKGKQDDNDDDCYRKKICCLNAWMHAYILGTDYMSNEK